MFHFIPPENWFSDISGGYRNKNSQLIFTCSNSTIETIEKGVKTTERRHDVVLVFLLLTLNIRYTFF